MSITIKEIARLAGVSPSSVSLVLNNRPNRISEKKKNLILQIANDNQYIPNAAARSLVTRKNNTFGLLIPDIENPFFSKLSKTLELQLRAEGYSLIIVNSNDTFEGDMILIDLLAAKGIDGLFVVISNESYLHQDIIEQKLTQLNLPFVMVDRIFDSFSCNKIYFDNVEGSYIATKYLLEKGHRKIACICNTFISHNSLSRIHGYRNAMMEYGIKVPKEYIIPANYRIEGGYEAAKQILDTDCTAIFVCNDMMTLGILRYFSEQDIHVPEDYAIVSYDNLLSDYLFGIEISSVNQDVEELGIKAWNIMKEAARQDTRKETKQKEICLMPTLVIH